MTNSFALTRFKNKADLQSGCAAIIGNTLENALILNGSAVFLGSGGRTPGPIYEALAARDMAWQNVTIGLTDERWTPPGEPGSNEQMLRDTLVQGRAASAQVHGMWTGGADPFQAASDLNAAYAPFCSSADCILLGMGPDTHTLSWFPDARGLETAMDPATGTAVAAIEAPQTDVTGPHTSRMTLTLPVIARGASILLLITGDEKLDVLTHAAPESPVMRMVDAAGDRLKVLYAP